MEINIAKTSGFCFGVNRAVNIVDQLLDQNKEVCTLGPIIHNPRVTEDFDRRGVKIIVNSSEVPKGYVMVIRSHGITKSALGYIKSQNIEHVDATCPFVKKIHNIVANPPGEKTFLLAAGDKNHPEMIGIRSYFNGTSYVFNDLKELKELVKKNQHLSKESGLMVAQTTFSTSEWAKCTNFINNVFTNIIIFDTICNTTGLRQKEAESLSKKSDLMIVIGGKQSSNTLKLYDICQKNTYTILVEKPEDLPQKISKHCHKIGIISGASTPQKDIHTIKENIKNYANRG